MKKFERKTIMQRLGKGKKKIIAITVVLCLVAAGVGGAVTKKNKSMAKDNGKAISATVETGTIKEGISGTGTIEYADTTEIMLPSDLEVKEICVSEGSYVDEGELLATVDETSLSVCIADVKEEISSLDSTITSKYSSSTTQYVTAGVSGTVEKIYGEAGDNVEDVMVENGALMLVKNGDETIRVIGSEGVIDSVNVSEGSSVSSSTKVMTLESDVQSGDYLQAVKDREELVSVLETLLAIKKNGGITASTSGMVQAINVTAKSSSTSASTDSLDVKTFSDNDTEEVGSLKESGTDVSENGSETTGEVHNIAAVTLTCLSGAEATEQGTVTSTSQSTEASVDASTVDAEKLSVLQSLTIEPGKIVGTTSAMEYADSATADTWNSCSEQYTEVAKGTWYVRYKATGTEAASSSVKVEVAEDKVVSTEAANTQTASTQTANTETASTEKTTTTASTGSGNAANANTTSTDSGSDKGNSTSDATGAGTIPTDISVSGNDSSSGTQESNINNKSDSASGSKSVATSTVKGSVSVGSSSAASTVSSSGTDAISTISAFTIANGDKMKVTMNVDELDILSVSVGLKAEISLDAVEGTTFDGTITNVSGNASSSNGTAQYPVEITFDKTEEMLSGMNAAVTVSIKEAKDVLVVPLAAVTDEGKTSYVYTGYDESSGNLTGKTEVTLGMSDENNVEIKDGLSEGDTIYYEMKGSTDSGSGSDSGMPGMPGDMKMGGDMPSFDKSSAPPSFDGDRPSGTNKPNQ